MVEAVNIIKQTAGLMLERLLINIRKTPKELTYEEKVRLLESGYRKKILYNQEGNDFLATSIEKNLPLMITRLGASELSCLNFYLQHRINKKRGYPRSLTDVLSINAGFFPVNDKMLDRFSELYLDCMTNVDIMAVWFNENENVICNSHCPDANLIELACLAPYLFDSPWSSRLKMKKVLVVHPFEESIIKQYKKRELLFDNPEILPEFTLETVKAVQSIAGSTVDYPTWFDALDDMCRQIEQTDFDIAIIGAGAYGLPLASFVKRLGKQAIHLGGGTQILFGIKGRRWEKAYADSLFNEHWTRPLDTETPQNNELVENGCYW